MSIAKITFLLLSIVSLASSGIAANLIDGAECASWDQSHNRYLVSSFWDGRIIALDTAKTQSVFAAGLGHCYGNLVQGDTLFVSWGQGVYILDLETGAILGIVPIPAAQHVIRSEPFGESVEGFIVCGI